MECWLINSILFLDGDDEGACVVLALDARSQVLTIEDRRNGLGKLVFKLAPFGNGQVFAPTTPDLRFPGITDGVLQLVISQASTATVMALPFASPLYRCPAGRGAFFPQFPFPMGSTF